MTNDRLFTYILLLTALGISAVAGYFSIIGLTLIFSAAFWPIVTMGAVLELGKLVTASFIYRMWDKVNWLLRTYFVLSVIILSAITSLGIFGYLSKAHIENSAKLSPLVEKEMIYDEKIKTLKETIETNRKSLLQLDAAVDQVMARSADERGAERSNQIRKTQQKERIRAADEIARAQTEIQKITEEKSPISLEIKKAESDLGPIKYVADVVYGTQDRDLLDKAVRLVIFVIIVVFDPLAVLLLIAANQTYRRIKEERVKPKIKRVVRKKDVDKNDTPSIESFLVDDNHQVIRKDNIADIGDINERS